MHVSLFTEKKQEMLDYAKEKYSNQLSIESKPVGSGVTMHYLTLNGVEIGLAAGGYTLGIHADKWLLHEAKGACAPAVNKKGFLVFGAHDLAGQLVDPFFVKVFKDGTMQLIVGEEHAGRVEALFRMLLVLAIGW